MDRAARRCFEPLERGLGRVPELELGGPVASVELPALGCVGAAALIEGVGLIWVELARARAPTIRATLAMPRLHGLSLGSMVRQGPGERGSRHARPGLELDRASRSIVASSANPAGQNWAIASTSNSGGENPATRQSPPSMPENPRSAPTRPSGSTTTKTPNILPPPTCPSSGQSPRASSAWSAAAARWASACGTPGANGLASREGSEPGRGWGSNSITRRRLYLPLARTSHLLQ